MNDQRRTKLSKYLSLILRHDPAKAGLTLDAAGWVGVEELLEGLRRQGKAVTRGELDEVVATNDKRRFAFSEDGLRLRASQGHSVEVDLGYAAAVPPAGLYHGTAAGSLASIRAEGIHRGSRHHVHLSPDAETAIKVGGRHGRPVPLRVDAGRMCTDGHAFYRSDNGVWLTDHVPPKYIEFPGDAP